MPIANVVTVQAGIGLRGHIYSFSLFSFSLYIGSNRKVSSIPCVYVCKSEQQLARDIFFKRKTYTCVAVNRKFSECLSVNTDTTQYSVPF